MLMIRLALAFIPRRFRDRFAEEIAADLERRRAFPLLLGCANVAFEGLRIRFELTTREIAHAFRALAKAPTFALTAVVAIALAIGAQVMVASVIGGVLLRPLPYPHADRLVFVGISSSVLSNRTPISYADARDLDAQATTLDGVAVRSASDVELFGEGPPRLLSALVVGARYFDLLGALPHIGRFFNADDLGARRVVISDRLWRELYHGDRAIVGRPLKLQWASSFGNDVYTVVGVAPPGFRDPSFGAKGLIQSDCWMLVHPTNARDTDLYGAIARVRAGAPMESARADVARIVRSLETRYPHEHAQMGAAAVTPMVDAIVGPAKSLLWLSYLAVAIVLGIACANVANISLVRAAARERELGIRTAIGATMRQIATQLSVEAFLICIAGAVVGVGLAAVALPVFGAFGASILPRWEEVRIDAPVLMYVGALVLVVTLLTGTLPSLFARPNALASVKAVGRTDESRSARRARSGLVVLEIALAMAVITSAGLVVRSSLLLSHVDPGFDGTNVTTVFVRALPAHYQGVNGKMYFLQRLTERLRSLPGVTDVAAAGTIPFVGTSMSGFSIPGHARDASDSEFNFISPTYFRTLRIPIVLGRAFDVRDRAASQPVAMVSEAFARKQFGTPADALGKSITPFRTSGSAPVSRTIVGIAGDTRSSFAGAPTPTMYVPMTQFPTFYRIAVRTAHASVSLEAEIENVFNELGSRATPPLVQSYDAIFATDTARSRTTADLFVGLASAALLLALSGIYAVTSYGVVRRTHEFGVRQAIGAAPWIVALPLLRTALAQAGCAIVVGLAITGSFARGLSALLFQTQTLEPTMIVLAAVVVVLCTLLAAALPAYRAMRVEPAVALKRE